MIETMVAFFVSALIMIFTMSMYSNLTSSLNRMRSSMALVRKASLVMAQLEKDLTTLYVPFLQEAIEPGPEYKKETAEDLEEASEKNLQGAQGSVKKKKKSKKLKEPITDQKQHKKIEQERLQNILLISPYDDEDKKIRGERWKLFRSLSGISTHPFTVYHEAAPLLVRFGYELLPDKKNSTPEKRRYLLFRKQTEDTDNAKLKPSDAPWGGQTQAQEEPIQELLIADNIAFLGLKITSEKKEKELELEKKLREKEGKKRELIHRFAWGGESEYSAHLPKLLTLYLSFWDDQDREIIFEASYPVVSYPTEYPAAIDALLTGTDGQLQTEKIQEKENKEDAAKTSATTAPVASQR